MNTAIVDIGTNSIRLLVAKAVGDEISVMKTALKTTRIGEGVGQSRCLSEHGMIRTLEGLAEFKEVLDDYQVGKIKVVATSAVRDAENRQEFLARVEEKLGWEIQVLEGEEEAYYSYLGAVKGLGGTHENTVVVDIGGGSTEFVWPDGEGIKCISLNLGAVRMTERNASLEEIRQMIEALPRDAFLSSNIKGVGVGGTFTTLAAIDQGLSVYDPDKIHGYKIHKKNMSDILRNLEAMSLRERKQVTGLQPERADIIIAGARIALAVAEWMGVSEITVSETDIMYGLLYHSDV